MVAVPQDARDGSRPAGPPSPGGADPPSPGLRGPGGPGARQPGPLGLSTRRRAYFAMMGVCLVLIILSWTLIWRFSIMAAVIMSAVALFIPPLAVIVANASPVNRQ